ncbi:MAG: relaxase/mobilization nuclease domain-containing protein [Lachnospiraceae bacterium]|nr:relaxase/mobilization nuclease domain-containing protein [Lachnospiraceae bacterium]
MAEVYGNVNVNYSYCKSVAQLKSAADYILGTKKEQIKEGIQKTRSDLYGAFGCSRDNFANSLLITRKMHDKKYSRYKQKDILVHKMSISFHPDDNDKLTYEEADKIAREFAYKFFWSKGYEAMWAVHTDTEHIHVHFIVSNCNLKDGKSFRRGMPELKKMSQFFGEQCRERGLTHSVRDTFYNEERTQERKSFAECQMQKHDKLSFREEIKTYVRLAMNSTGTRTLEDVVEMLKKIYLMDIRLKGNTISYALPYYAGKTGKAQAVRGSKLGNRFTVAGIRQYMQEKEQKQVEYRRTMQDIEEAKQYLDDYEEWREEAKKAGDSFYEAFDHFQADHDVSENDEEIFYGSVFQEFNEQWQGKSQAVSKQKSEVSKAEKVDFSKLSLEERAKLLPPPTSDQMAELKEYQKRMGYDESKMKSMKYKMKVYDEFLKEYEYRKKHYGVKEDMQRKRRDREHCL